MFLADLDGFILDFCNSLKISTDYEYNFECGLLKSKQILQEVKSVTFKDILQYRNSFNTNKVKVMLQIVRYWIFHHYWMFSLHTPMDGQGVLLGQYHPPPLCSPLPNTQKNIYVYESYESTLCPQRWLEFKMMQITRGVFRGVGVCSHPPPIFPPSV